MKEKIRTEDKRELHARFRDLLGQFLNLTERMAKAQRRIVPGAHDPEQDKMVLYLDSEKHKIHTNLFYAGKKLGMDEAEVSIYILVNKGNLAEYGLPEIPVSIGDDRSALLFVYGIDPIGRKEKWGIDDEKDEEEFQRQMDANLNKAQSLAKKYKIEIFDHEVGAYHEITREIGVVVPKERVEEIAQIIRDNPDYRPQSQIKN